MSFYPDHTFIATNRRVERVRLLPPDVSGEALVKVGDKVKPDDVVLRGVRLSDYTIIDVAAHVGLPADHPHLQESLGGLEVGQKLTSGTPLGTPTKRLPKRRLPQTPAPAVVRLVENGRVILQVNPEVVEIQARFPGVVTQVEAGLGVAIETIGALIQCAWGNGKYSAGPYAFEPGTLAGEGGEFKGLSDFLKLDIRLSPYRAKTIILTRPITEFDLLVIEQQELNGLVAPCAPLSLLPKAQALPVPVLLTEGFGNLPPTSYLYDLLLENCTYQAVFNGEQVPDQLGARPEIIILTGERTDAQAPTADLPLFVGQKVRTLRPPYQGRVGVISDLPAQPQVLENGLRVACAQVRLQSGEKILIPRMNLAILGQDEPPAQ